MKVHRSGKGSKYVRGRLPFTLVHQEKFKTKQEAMKREYEIKQWPRQKKLQNLQLSLRENP